MAAERIPDSPPPPAPQREPDGFVRQLSDVMDLPFVLVGAVVIAAGLGYFVDRRFHTSPAFTLILGVVGFAAGIIEVLRRLTGRNKRAP